MNQILLSVLFCCTFTLNLYSQDFKDKIFLNSGDTINCRITMINNTNIFYDYPKKRKFESTYVSLKEVDTWELNNENATILNDSLKAIQGKGKNLPANNQKPDTNSMGHQTDTPKTKITIPQLENRVSQLENKLNSFRHQRGMGRIVLGIGIAVTTIGGFMMTGDNVDEGQIIMGIGIATTIGGTVVYQFSDKKLRFGKAN